MRGWIKAIKEILGGVFDHADMPPPSEGFADALRRIRELEDEGRFCAPASADPVPVPSSGRRGDAGRQ